MKTCKRSNAIYRAATPPASTWKAQRRAFFVFRRKYNEERPHEALGQKPPGAVYVPSARKYPAPLIDLSNVLYAARVDNTGSVLWGKQRVFISHALVGEYIELLPDRHEWLAMFGPVPLGHFKPGDKALRIRTRPRRSNYVEVSGISWR